MRRSHPGLRLGSLAHNASLGASDRQLLGRFERCRGSGRWPFPQARAETPMRPEIEKQLPLPVCGPPASVCVVSAFARFAAMISERWRSADNADALIDNASNRFTI